MSFQMDNCCGCNQGGQGGLFWAYHPWIGFADNNDPLMVWRNLYKTFTLNDGSGTWYWSNVYFDKDGTITATDNLPAGGFPTTTTNTAQLSIPYRVADIDADCDALLGTLSPGYTNVGQAWVCPQLDTQCHRPPPCSLAPIQLGAPTGQGWNFRGTLGQTSPMIFGPADCGCFYTTPKRLLPAAYRYYSLPNTALGCFFSDIRFGNNVVLAGFMEKMKLIVPNMQNPYADAYYDQNGNLLYCSQKPASPTPIQFVFDYAPNVIGWRQATDFGSCV